MGNALLKQVIVELTRSGCRIDTLLYDPPAVTFRTPTGLHCALTADHDTYRLSQRVDGAPDDQHVEQFTTMREALRAAVAA